MTYKIKMTRDYQAVSFNKVEIILRRLIRTAPDECFPHIKKLRKNAIPKQTPGNRRAVWKAAFFHSNPFNVL